MMTLPSSTFRLPLARLVAAVLASLVAAGTARGQERSTFAVASNIGGETCVAIDGTARPGEPVAIVLAYDKPQVILKGRIGAKRTEPCPRLHPTYDDWGVNHPDEPVVYAVSLDPKSKVDYWVGILVRNPPATLRIEGGLAIGYRRNGAPLHFWDCTSNEGIHMTVWAGPPSGGRRLWHPYNYLGYGTDPNCPGPEFFERATR